MKQAAFAILIFISTGLVGAYAQDLTAQSDRTTFNGFFNLPLLVNRKLCLPACFQLTWAFTLLKKAELIIISK